MPVLNESMQLRSTALRLAALTMSGYGGVTRQAALQLAASGSTVSTTTEAALVGTRRDLQRELEGQYLLVLTGRAAPRRELLASFEKLDKALSLRARATQHLAKMGPSSWSA